MKKIIALLLAVISIVAFASCRAATPENPEKTSDDSTVPSVVAGTAEAVDAETSEVDTEDNATSYVVDTKPEETTATEETAPQMDEGKAVSLARQFLGETDPDTGYAYSYQFETITSDGDYKIKVSWYIAEDERFSTCGYLLVSPDGDVTKFDW